VGRTGDGEQLVADQSQIDFERDAPWESIKSRVPLLVQSHHGRPRGKCENTDHDEPDSNDDKSSVMVLSKAKLFGKKEGSTLKRPQRKVRARVTCQKSLIDGMKRGVELVKP